MKIFYLSFIVSDFKMVFFDFYQFVCITAWIGIAMADTFYIVSTYATNVDDCLEKTGIKKGLMTECVLHCQNSTAILYENECFCKKDTCQPSHVSKDFANATVIRNAKCKYIVRLPRSILKFILEKRRLQCLSTKN